MAKIKVTQSGTTVTVGDDDKVDIQISGGGTVNIVADPNDAVDKIQIDFGGDESNSTHATIDLSTFSQDNLHIDIKDYDPSDIITLSGSFNHYVDPNDPDEYSFQYIGADGETYTAFVHAKDGNEKDFTTEVPPIIICFGKGTLIETIDGPKKIEDLQPDDMVLTYDHSIAAVKWIGSTKLDEETLAKWPELRPIRVSKSAFGAGRPSVDTILSPNHRVLIKGWRAELMFGDAEVLVPIKSLVNGSDICQMSACHEVEYFHLLLENHQIIFSNGLASESLFLGDQAAIALMGPAKTDLQKRLGLRDWNRLASAPTIRPTVRARIGRALAA